MKQSRHRRHRTQEKQNRVLHECVYTKHTWHLLFFNPSGERDPPLLLSSRFLPFCPFLWWEFFLILCEVLGKGCRMSTNCKALWGIFVIFDSGSYKINWIEFYNLVTVLNLSRCFMCITPLLQLAGSSESSWPETQSYHTEVGVPHMNYSF